jgi:two-component system OmpR family sensor kinase
MDKALVTTNHGHPGAEAMSANRSPFTDRTLVVAWATFAAFNVVLMWLVPGQETIPFHFVWISLALVYGFTSWRTSWMVVALVSVTLCTGVVLVHHAAAGEIRWEETSEEPLMAGIFVVMVWHVHRRNVLLREVQRVNEMERRRLERQQLFVRLASHELRTPITVARGYTELVRAVHNDPATVEDTAIVLDELDKLTRITQRLVTLIQVDEPHPLRRTDVDAELFRIVRRWEPTAVRGWVVQSAVGEALINSERFEAALDCLLENAIKFTKPHDHIEITGLRAPDGWIVQVRDSGSGISAETMHRLTSTPPGEPTSTGTGLGLAIVSAVVDSLGGRLIIGGELRVGTTVRLFIPQLPLDPREVMRPPDQFAADPLHADLGWQPVTSTGGNQL